MVRVFVPVQFVASVAVTVKLTPVPDPDVGVPLITPELLRDRPAGNATEVTALVYGAVAPDAAKV